RPRGGGRRRRRGDRRCGGAATDSGRSPRTDRRSQRNGRHLTHESWPRDAGSGYSNLEFDLAAGERGSRYDRLGDVLTGLTGAPASLVVNNGAAAMLLILDTFARG